MKRAIINTVVTVLALWIFQMGIRVQPEAPTEPRDGIRG